MFLGALERAQLAVVVALGPPPLELALDTVPDPLQQVLPARGFTNP